MTRKQALQRAITVLAKNPEYAEDIRILQEIYDELPLIHWSDSSIRDTVEQFILDNGRVPTASDFKKKGMPPHPVIKQKYKITLGEWLEKHYPVRKPTYEELKEKYTIVMVTHNMQQAVRVYDYTAFFLLGELVEFGKTDDIFSQPQDQRTEDYITGRFG